MEVCQEELKNVKENVKYIIEEEFKIKYRLDNILSEGTFGVVYESGTEFIVKSFKYGTEGVIELIKELNIYSSISHPCILSPIEWTIINDTGYLISRKGVRIIEAFARGMITIEEIISDSLSAIAYMNSLGIAHRDIKPSNMIYLPNSLNGETKGKCMIIDMGLTVKAFLHKNGEYYHTGPAYTSVFQDPEYYEKQYNSIKSEIYSLAISYKSIITNRYPDFGDLVDYKNNDGSLNRFFKESSKLTENRLSIQELYDFACIDIIPYSRRYVGNSFKASRITPFDKKVYIHFTRILIKWLIELSIIYRLKSETLFLCIHLIHRIFESIYKKYNESNSCIQLFGCVNLYLASIVSNDTVLRKETFKQLSDDKSSNYSVLFEKMTIDCLLELKGIISTTTWDYGKSRDDIKRMLLEIIYNGYNLTGEEPINIDDNKRYTMDTIFTSQEYENISESKECTDIILQNTVFAEDFDIDIKESPEHLMILIERLSLKIDTNYVLFISCVLRNRHALSKLSIRNVYIIFQALYNERHEIISSFILDTIFTFNWKVYGDKLLKLADIRMTNLLILTEETCNEFLLNHNFDGEFYNLSED